MSQFEALGARFGDLFRAEEPLARYTAARLGGIAAGVLRVKTTGDLCWVVDWARTEGIPWLILGGGANVLISDAGFRGLVIINQSSTTHIDDQTGIAEADSGVNFSGLARRCMAKGIKGLEWAVNVPGSVGGAVVNNAGAHGGDLASVLLDASILDSGVIQTWEPGDFDYAYRYSNIKGKKERYVVLSARLKLEPGHAPHELNQIADAFVAHRKKTQPPGASLGSMFKNPPGDYAGRLIEAAELKGSQIGGVQISTVHANFFVNTGDGTARDYSELIELVQKTVLERFGIELELEVERLGDW